MPSQLLSASTLAFLLAAAPAFAADDDFATKAAQGGLAEVQAGQLAQQKAASAQVKQFGATLVQDHSAANGELQQIAGSQKIELPKQPSEEQRSAMKKLQGLSGAQFDQQFVQDQIEDHQKDIALFQQEATSGKDGALKAYAQKSLPVLRKHLQIAQSLTAKSR